MIAVVSLACADNPTVPLPSPHLPPVAETKLHRSDDLRIEFLVPTSWEAGAAPMPYASCFDCLIIGPSEATPPRGITLLEVTTDFSGPSCGSQFNCPIMAFFGIRGLPVGVEEPLTVDGFPAKRQRVLRQPPLGLVNVTGDTRLYIEIATGIDTLSGPDLLVIGFFRQDDAVGKREVEAAYVALLESLEIDE